MSTADIEAMYEFGNLLLRFVVADYCLIMGIVAFAYKVIYRNKGYGLSLKSQILFLIAVGHRWIYILNHTYPWYIFIPSFLLFLILLTIVILGVKKPMYFQHQFDKMSMELILSVIAVSTIVVLLWSECTEQINTLGAFYEAFALYPQFYYISVAKNVRQTVYSLILSIMMHYIIHICFVIWLDYDSYNIAFYIQVVARFIGFASCVWFLSQNQYISDPTSDMNNPTSDYEVNVFSVDNPLHYRRPSSSTNESDNL